jgi:phytoene dehydrogenase-like protein
MPLDNIRDAYDVIVIGSGLGGLTAANRLAGFKHRVLLLEQHHVLGGLAAFFKRGGHIFDVSLHGFPYGMIKTCRKYWTREIAESIVQLDQIVFDNPQFSTRTTFDKTDFTRVLVDEFGIPRETIDSFFEELGKMDFFDDQTETTRQMFQRFFPDRSDVVRFLMEPITYANGSTLDEPAITYGIVFSNFMSRGVYTVRGGTDWLISAMEAELIKNGVDIATRARAERIVVENGRVSGVVVNGQHISANCVLSNANLKATALQLIGRDNLPADFADLAEAMRLSTSSAQVYMGIREGESIPDIGDLLFTSTAPEFDSDLLASRNVTSRTYSVYYPKTRPGHNRYTIVASMNSRYEDWATLTDDEYAASKADLAETTIDALEKYLPDARDKIDCVEVATPKTFERYTGHIEGASFGTKFEGLKISTDLPNVVPGAFHTGSSAIIMSGWLGAANYGVIVANKVDEYLEKRGCADGSPGDCAN